MATDNTAPEIPAEENVDLNHIKEIMGPFPDEDAPVKDAKKSKPKKSKPETNPELSSAAEVANEALMAMSPNLGEAEIKKVDYDDLVAELESSKEPVPLPEVTTPEKLPESKPAPVSDAATDKAVDEIVAEEADTVLEAEDKKLEADNEATAPKKRNLKRWLKGIWANPRSRWALIASVGTVILAIALIPWSRYFVLNNVGVRSSLNLTVVDSGTQLPLKNVQVTAAGVTGQTDDNGRVRLSRLKLGATKLKIQKRAFAASERNVVVGWGSNPLGQYQISAIGTQYSFVVTDFLSGKPIEKAQASSGEGNAISDKEGKITLTLDTSTIGDTEKISVQVSAETYRTDTIAIEAGNKEAQAVKMVPAAKSVFISKRSGKYDVYIIDVDGKNEKKLVAGTGLERDDITVVADKVGKAAALVATRENIRNKDGYLLSTLYTVDLDSGALAKVDQSEQIQLVGWSKDRRLTYVKIAAGASGSNPKRHRLMSYSAENLAVPKELATSNYFNDVLMVDDRIYYAPSNAFQDSPKPGFFVISPDGSNLVTLYDKEVWNIFRTEYETAHLSVGDKWYTYKLGGPASTVTLGSAPSNQRSKLYENNPNGSVSAWVDNRDGKGVLLSYEPKAKKETVLQTKNGLKTPVRWLNDKYLIFRVNDGKETADYVLNTAGGEAKKIIDVTDTSGIDRWYYY